MLDIIIKKAATTSEFEQGKLLFEEYAATLDFDLEYQDFKKELDSIDQQYMQPEGALILCVIDNEKIAGCAGIRKFAAGIAELKRLYVRPDYRDLKIGRRLLESAIETAGRMGYTLLRLDTVPGQTKAQALYRRLGFYQIESYRYSPIDGTIYFEKTIAP